MSRRPARWTNADFDRVISAAREQQRQLEQADQITDKELTRWQSFAEKHFGSVAVTRLENGGIRFTPTGTASESTYCGNVYFILAESVGLVKIGYSGEVKGRIDALRTMSPVPLTLLGSIRGDYRDENALHVRFAAHRSHGEWFKYCDEIRAYIESVLERKAA